MDTKETIAPWSEDESELLHVHCLHGDFHVDILCQYPHQLHTYWSQMKNDNKSGSGSEGWKQQAEVKGLTATIFSPGSYIKAAEKSYSMVRGGRTREAAALAWERQGPTPNQISYKNWAKSVLDNPAVVESMVKSSTSANKPQV